MKKFIALVALVMMSAATTAMYAQESRAERRADRKAQRDAERARMKAEEQVADAISYDDAVAALKAHQFVLEADQDVPQRTDGFCKLQHQLRISEPRTWYRAGSIQHCISRS